MRIRILASLVGVTLSACASSSPSVWARWDEAPPRVIHAIAIGALNPEAPVQQKDTEALIAAFRAQFPGVTVVRPPEYAEWRLTFLKTDTVSCNASAIGTARPLWCWSVIVNHHERANNGEQYDRTIGTVSGETPKSSTSPAQQFVVAFHRVLSGEPLPVRSRNP
jgi:hypothetical protein